MFREMTETKDGRYRRYISIRRKKISVTRIDEVTANRGREEDRSVSAILTAKSAW